MLRTLKNETSNTSLIGLTVGHIKKLKKLFSDNIFSEKYLVFYGHPKSKIIEKVPTFYIDPPLIRGYAIRKAMEIVHQPITVLVNADSKCVDKSTIKRAIEDLELGKYKIFLSAPLSSKNFDRLYNGVVIPILKSVLGIHDLAFPSYSIIIGLKKYLDVNENILWSYEHLAALNILINDKSSIRIENNNCIDTIPDIFNGMEDLFIKSLARSIIKVSVKYGAVEKDFGEKLIEGLQ
ncbi:MAG: hypothetical protein QXT53_02030 [Ignisphaera sp.]